MKTKIAETTKTVAYTVYLIQLNYKGQSDNWTLYNWSIFAKGKAAIYTGRREEYFTHSDAGRFFRGHPDRPPHYYGEKFWTDVPAFVDLGTAKACLRAITDGDWLDGHKARIVKIDSITTLSEVK